MAGLPFYVKIVFSDDTDYLILKFSKPSSQKYLLSISEKNKKGSTTQLSSVFIEKGKLYCLEEVADPQYSAKIGSSNVEYLDKVGEFTYSGHEVEFKRGICDIDPPKNNEKDFPIYFKIASNGKLQFSKRKSL